MCPACVPTDEPPPQVWPPAIPLKVSLYGIVVRRGPGKTFEVASSRGAGLGHYQMHIGSAISSRSQRLQVEWRATHVLALYQERHYGYYGRGEGRTVVEALDQVRALLPRSDRRQHTLSFSCMMETPGPWPFAYSSPSFPAPGGAAPGSTGDSRPSDPDGDHDIDPPRSSPGYVNYYEGSIPLGFLSEDIAPFGRPLGSIEDHPNRPVPPANTMQQGSRAFDSRQPTIGSRRSVR